LESGQKVVHEHHDTRQATGREGAANLPVVNMLRL
jgi:hypothetical protein